MSEYPNSATLHAFRGKVYPPIGMPYGEHPFDKPVPVFGTYKAHGAWPHELRDGIGYENTPFPRGTLSVAARVEANRMRTKAAWNKRSQ